MMMGYFFRPLFIFMLLPLLSLGGCAGGQTSPSSLPLYQQQLVKEYQSLLTSGGPRSEAAVVYRTKMRHAREGKKLTPETPELWKARNPQDLYYARSQLVVALEDKNPDLDPAHRAAALSAYDCWVLESYQRESTKERQCRRTFYEALAKLEGGDNLNSRPNYTRYREDPYLNVELPQSYLVFFSEGGLELTGEANETLDRVTEVIEETSGDIAISIIGHSDTVGSLADATQISEQRVLLIEDELRSRSSLLEFPRVDTRAAGENELLVITNDDVAEPLNRRVEIILR